VRSAAARAAKRADRILIADAHSDGELARAFCGRGHVVLASEADLAAFAQAFRPVYARLERDPEVKAMIADIRDLAGRTKPDPPPEIPRKCSRLEPTTRAAKRDPSFLDGTYRTRITRAGALKVGGDPNDPVIGTVAEWTLRDGRWVDGSGEHGTFTVAGNRIAFTWPAKGYTNTFTFTRGGNGTLRLTPVLPMDVGDRVVSSSAPWVRVGPPVRKTP
jgi:hypothetical protein